MSWPLVFIHFLLASTSRLEEDGVSVEYKELLCRMFGAEAYVRDNRCKEWAREGDADASCGCPVEPPAPYEPTDYGDALQPGWVSEEVGPSTAITYSFEKEWEGAAKGLHELYKPVGAVCEDLWGRLKAEEEKVKFMDRLRLKAEEMVKFMDRPRLKSTSAEQGSSLKRYLDPSDKCNIQDEHPYHTWLPLRRRDDRPRISGISGFVEYDHGPWEIKASTFYYHLEKMYADVKEILPSVDADGFPADRRIQVHVVAPVPDEHTMNQDLRKAFKLVQLYYSDYMFLHLGFPNGPEGGLCGSGGYGNFKCDVFSDRWNRVLGIAEAQNAYIADEKQVEQKPFIVGLRSTDTYGRTPGEGPLLVGFEIRKSSTFEHAIDTARAIARTLNSIEITPEGYVSGYVGIEDGRSISISKVEAFAKDHRMNFFECPFCEETRDQKPDWNVVMNHLARFFYYKVGQRGELPDGDEILLTGKLYLMLTLLLCSKWTELVDVGADVATEKRNGVLHALGTVKGVLHALGNANNSDDAGLESSMRAFHTEVTSYAFELSKLF